jgi:ABC-type bacteriocin/lantibiotic exporter with double-glycine peptidase domain
MLATNATMVKVFVGTGTKHWGGLITGVIIAAISSWQLCVVCLGMLPLISAAGYIQVSAALKATQFDKESIHSSNGIANEAFQNIRTITGLGQEKYRQYFW